MIPVTHKKNGKPKLFYGWWIVFYGFMLMAVSFSIIMSCHSLFVLPVTQSLGFSRGEFTLTFTLLGLSAAASSAWVGRRLSRSQNLKRALTGFVLLAGVGFAAFSFARQPWHFYGLAILMGPGFVGSSNLAGSLLVNHWFVDKRGFALGIVAAGSGIGTALLSPVISRIIAGYGWQAGYVFSGALILLVCLPLTWKLAIRDPEVLHLQPLARKTVLNMSENTAEHLSHDAGFTLAELKVMPSFWAFFATMFLLCVVVGGSQLTIVAYFTELGHDPSFAALMFSVQALGMLVGKLGLGAFFDRFGARRGILVAIAALAVTMAGYLKASSLPVAVAASVLVGMAASMTTVGNAYLTGSFFGRKDFGNVYGLVNMTMMTGATAGPLVTSMVYDRMGSYEPAWMAFLILVILCGVSLTTLQAFYYRKLLKK